MMTRDDTINDKINYFLKQQCKVHITKIPTVKFPNGKFHNGEIVEKYKDFILFNDPLEDSTNPIKIFFSEIDDIEEYKQRGGGEW